VVEEEEEEGREARCLPSFPPSLPRWRACDDGRSFVLLLLLLLLRWVGVGQRVGCVCVLGREEEIRIRRQTLSTAALSPSLPPSLPPSFHLWAWQQTYSYPPLPPFLPPSLPPSLLPSIPLDLETNQVRLPSLPPSLPPSLDLLR